MDRSKVLDSLINNFNSEALKRGIVVNTTEQHLIVKFGDLGKRSGSCKPNTRPKIITIDSMLWKQAPNTVKEMLLFHEMGHCILGLGHNNHLLPTGECQSWMREGSRNCKVNFINNMWRAYYIDQLFSSHTTFLPSWYISGARPAGEGKLMKSQCLRKNQVEYIDTIAIKALKGWRINLQIPDYINAGSVGLRLNEYWFDFAVSTVGQQLEVQQTIMLYQFESMDNNIFSSEKVSVEKACRELILEKSDSVILVFFDREIKLVVPLTGERLSIGVYSSLDDTGLQITDLN